MATARWSTSIGTAGDEGYRDHILAAIAAARANITAVPGSGGILGIGVFNGVVYAARDAEDGKTSAIYSGSTNGWTLLQGGFIPGGRWRFDVSNFTGSSKTLSLFGCDGRNNPIVYDGEMVSKIHAIWPTVATSTSSVDVATGDKTFVLIEVDRDYNVGDAVTVWDDADAGNFMAGAVKTWTSGTKTLVVTVATIGGTGTIAAWTVGKTDYSDKPTDLLNFKNHLFLAFPHGQLQTSDLGDPFNYTTTASLFGTGFEITDLLMLKGDSLAIYGSNSISILSGTSQLDWLLDVLSTNSGASKFTAIEVAGIGIHADSTGIRSLQAMQAYDDYEAASFSRESKKTFDILIPHVVDASTVKDSQQYRLYCQQGKVLVCAVITPNAAVTPSDVAFSVLDYGREISCSASSYLKSGEGVNFFGTADGFVMREGVGTSFDGGEITSAVMLPFNHFKSPASNKRFRRLVFDLEADGTVSLSFKQLFNYDEGFSPPSVNQQVTALGKGGAWDVDQWDTFQWGQPIHNQGEINISGVGRNMGLLVWHESAEDVAFTLQGVMIHYSILGMVR
jgi:hypothetical protein